MAILMPVAHIASSHPPSHCYKVITKLEIDKCNYAPLFENDAYAKNFYDKRPVDKMIIDNAQ